MVVLPRQLCVHAVAMDSVPALPFVIDVLHGHTEPDAELDAELTRIALAANDRYLEDVLESMAFCPFAREGRKQGQTERHVVIARTHDASALLPLFERAVTTGREVTQVIFPAAEVSPEAFRAFALQITEACHAALGIGPKLAIAPLHPEAVYRTESAFALVPLFRRAPDPTLQWVSLAALDAIYGGRGSDTQYVDPADMAAFAAAEPPKRLYDRIADTNFDLAERLGVDKIEAPLRDLHDQAKGLPRRAPTLTPHDPSRVGPHARRGPRAA